MTQYSITVSKESLSFAAGHFITYGGGLCETLHGHNYRAGVTLTGELDEHALVYDFVRLKSEMTELTGKLDHKMLLPLDNPLLQIHRDSGEVEVKYGANRYVFPEQDVIFLPVANTTAELLAGHLADRLVAHLAEVGATNIHQIEVEVEESFGQSGWCIRRTDPEP
jgi:6-pyruvoyltetrahydropterin/6-carboxytetrahydropterin synthase